MGKELGERESIIIVVDTIFVQYDSQLYGFRTKLYLLRR